MNPSAIATLRKHFKPFFDDRGPVIWPEDSLVVRGDDPESAPDFELLEDAIRNDAESDYPIGLTGFVATNYSSALEDLELRGYHASQSSEVVSISTAIGTAIGTGFPGGPYAGGPTSFALPPDAYGCYLPWHEFQPKDWGIYLIFENLLALRDDLHSLTQPFLSRTDCATAALIFVFHHEAYHNAIETFSARLEIAHRSALYIKGFRTVYTTAPLPGSHEEGLATAYALLKVRTEAFQSQPPTSRQFKRRLVLWALSKIVSSMPPIYAAAIPIVKSKAFDKYQQRFQEHNVAVALPGILALPDTLAWLAFPDALRPSIQRNKSYSYLVSKSNPILRSRASIRYIDRAAFVGRLNAVVGGGVAAQKRSKEPKWRSTSGKTVSIPKGREIQLGTAAAILRQLGVDEGIFDFMKRP